jgi:hypothetical protein
LRRREVEVGGKDVLRGPGWIGLWPVVLDRVGAGRDSKRDRMTLGTKDMREAEERRVRERSSVLRELVGVAEETVGEVTI